MKYYFFLSMLLLSLLSCKKEPVRSTNAGSTPKIIDKPSNPYIVVLGIAQDAGYPQINCQKACCERVREHPELARFVSSIALVDPVHNQSWIFDATPDFNQQTGLLAEHLAQKTMPDGLFLTHGHMGHYTGLMELGREAMNASNLPVYVMPRMHDYLTHNGPWSQLVSLHNIALTPIEHKKAVQLNQQITVEPFLVPHRDEFTETVGYLINVMGKKVLFIPDIDKWEKWDERIETLVTQVDYAFLDATFYKNGEIERDMQEVPHPFVQESMALFEQLAPQDKEKIYFIHFNHTNPLLIEGSKAQQEVKDLGFKYATQGMVLPL